MALVIAPVDRTDFPGAFRFNLASPRLTPGSVSDRPNLLIHTAREAFPYRQTVLAVHAARLVSVALGAVALFGVWRAAHLLIPGDSHLPVLAVALVAFIPQFVFGSGLVNNDALAAAAAAWTLAALLRLMNEGGQRGVAAAGAGVGLGAALLSKIGMVVLIPLPALALWLVWRNRVAGARTPTPTLHLTLAPNSALGTIFRSGLVVYGAAAATAGWWYLRNWQLYGDPLAWQEWQVLTGVGRAPPTAAEFMRDMLGLFGTFWADFNLRTDGAMGWLFGVLVVLALAGWVRRLGRRDGPAFDRSGWIVALALFGLLLASAIRYSFLVTEIHGRLMYPALATVGVGLALGLAAWGRRLSWWLSGTAVACMLGLSALAPLLLIEPAYRRPVLGTRPLPAGVPPAPVAFGGQVKLVGFHLAQSRIAPGGALGLVTYWQTEMGRAQAIPDLRQVVALVQPDGSVVGRAEAVLGTTVYPSSEWLPGETIVAETRVPVSADLNGPSVARVWLGVRTEAGHMLPTDRGDTVVLGRVAAGGSREACTGMVSAEVSFGGLVRLVGFRIDPQAVTLCWEALELITDDYTIFVHVAGDGGMIATADSPPRRGNYPTSAWVTGEQVEDPHWVRVPEEARVVVGLYRAENGERLVRDDTGETEYELRP